MKGARIGFSGVVEESDGSDDNTFGHRGPSNIGDRGLEAVLGPVRRGAGVVAAATVPCVAALTASVVVLFPVAIDVHESWVPQPNERSSCAGWSFRHYPPGP